MPPMKLSFDLLLHSVLNGWHLPKYLNLVCKALQQTKVPDPAVLDLSVWSQLLSEYEIGFLKLGSRRQRSEHLKDKAWLGGVVVLDFLDCGIHVYSKIFVVVIKFNFV